MHRIERAEREREKEGERERETFEGIRRVSVFSFNGKLREIGRSFSIVVEKAGISARQDESSRVLKERITALDGSNKVNKKSHLRGTNFYVNIFFFFFFLISLRKEKLNLRTRCDIEKFYQRFLNCLKISI